MPVTARQPGWCTVKISFKRLCPVTGSHDSISSVPNRFVERSQCSRPRIWATGSPVPQRPPACSIERVQRSRTRPEFVSEPLDTAALSSSATPPRVQPKRLSRIDRRLGFPGADTVCGLESPAKQLVSDDAPMSKFFHIVKAFVAVGGENRFLHSPKRI